MEISLLKQEIEFLKFQLEDYKTRETQQKNMYEAMLNSLQNPSSTKPSTDDYQKALSNLQDKLNDSINSETLLKSQLELFEQSSFQTVSNLKIEIKALKSEIESLQLGLKAREAEIFSNAEQLKFLVQERETLESLLEKQKNDSIKRQEQIIKDLEYLHQFKLSSMTSKINTLYSKIAELSQGNMTADIKKLLNPDQISKSAEIIKSCDMLKSVIGTIQSTDIQQVLSSMLFLYEDLFSQDQKSASKHTRSYTFAPSENFTSKENVSEQENFKKIEMCYLFSSAFQCEFCKQCIVKQTFCEHLSACMNNKTEKQVDLTCFKTDLGKIEKMEEQISQLRLTVGKLKNQRDKAKINADKLLSTLKQTKLELAISEEQSGQKNLELKQEIKNLLNFLLVLRSHLQIPQNFSVEINKTIEDASRLFGGKVALNLT